jgi:transcriptional regulator with XRE-family HTH domain
MAKKNLNSDEILKKVGERLKQLRIAKGYSSYEQFAWDNELNRVQYWRMESGANFTIKSLLKIVAVHKITLEEFFRDIIL